MRLESRVDPDRLVPGCARLPLDLLVFEDLLQGLADPFLIVDDHHAARAHDPDLGRLYSTTPVVCTCTAVTAGSPLTGPEPLGGAPAICLVHCFTNRPRISMPRSVTSVMARKAGPGRPRETRPALRPGPGLTTN